MEAHPIRDDWRYSLIKDEWGTVCDDGFGANETIVACRQLGYDGYVSCSEHYGEGSGKIWMDDVQCDDKVNYRSRLADCTKRDGEDSVQFRRGSFWGRHNCRHSEDVGIICSTSGK